MRDLQRSIFTEDFEAIFERLERRHPFINMTITEIHIIHLHYSHSTDLANSITHGIWEWYYEVIRLETQSSITLSADISLGESLLIRYGPSVAPVYSISLFNGFLLFLPTLLTHILLSYKQIDFIT